MSLTEMETKNQCIHKEGAGEREKETERESVCPFVPELPTTVVLREWVN
jgi:hypothetical protein